MKRFRYKIFLLIIFFVFAFASYFEAMWFVDVESGWVFSGRNDIRIPGDTGTQFSLTDDLTTDSAPFIRLRLGARFHPRHTISILWAPLSLDAAGSVDRTVLFFEEEFSPNVPLTAGYTFNSYRVRYRFTLVSRDRWRLGVGFTAKIRDAVVRVEGEGKSSEKTNVGFVPLLNFQLEWLLSEKWSLLVDADAAAAPGGQGRAEDVLLALRFRFNEMFAVKVGYRLLEGGADVQETYNFAFINYLVVGTTIYF